MILILEPNTSQEGASYQALMRQLERLTSIRYRVHREVGTEVTLTEIYLIGNTGALTTEQMQVLPCVAKVVRVSEQYRVLGRHQQGDDRPSSFEYNGVHFGQDTSPRLRGTVRGRLRREYVEGMMQGAEGRGPGLHAHGRVQAAHQSRIRSRATASSACPTCSSSPASTASA